MMLLFLFDAWALLPRLLTSLMLGVLLAAGIPSVLNANAVVLSTVQESTITVKEKEVYCNNSLVHPQLVVKDQAGNVITQTTAGTQVSIEGSIDLDCNASRGSSVAIFEVRDPEGMTVYFAWQTLLDSGRQITIGSSWMPDKPGNYDVRFFPIICLQCSGVFHNIVTYEITVV